MRIWLGIAVLLVVLAYGLPIYDMISNGILNPGSAPIGV